MTRTKTPVYKVKGRIFGPPPSDVDKLESVILGDEFPLAGDVNVSEYILIVLGHVEDFDGDELLEVSDGGEGRHTDKLPTQLRQLLRIRTFQHQVDLLIKPVSFTSQEKFGDDDERIFEEEKPVVVEGGSRLWSSFLLLWLGVLLFLLLFKVLSRSN